MAVTHDERFPYTSQLDMPVIGLESEFKVFVDDVEIGPEEKWRTPAAFIDRPLLKRTNKSLQLPTGGALYFDGGVIEVVTPVIEIAPQSTGRVVRSLWEQIGFAREQFDQWEVRTGERIRLQAFSCHVNISFELGREERSSDRTVQKLAVLLAHLLPIPAILLGANRRSTGLGVRPRRERIEITMDFTPDPGLMSAAVALIVGIVRAVIAWPSYRLDELRARGIPRLANVAPGKHPSRKGWITKDYHFPRSPFTSDIDAADWLTSTGERTSLREVALQIATYFGDAIRDVADPFSVRLMFSVLRGDTPSLLDLPDRPAAYDDVGRGARWGAVIPELENFESMMDDANESESLRAHVAARAERRVRHLAEAKTPLRRRADVEEKLAPPWSGEQTDRRGKARRSADRRSERPAPSPSLTRSAYESVFLNLGSRRRLRIGDEILTPVNVKGWYHAIFETTNGDERMLSIDQLLAYASSWV
jgi:hypothetical protein